LVGENITKTRKMMIPASPKSQFTAQCDVDF